jgi:glycerol uptake facilitator-like aquaporin
VPFFYWEEVSFSSLAIDTASEAFGTFVFVFFVLLTTETNYMAGEYFRYMLIAIMLLAGRMYIVVYHRFTLRRGCLNPVIGVVFQLFAAIEKQNIMLLLYSLTLLIGPLLGGLIAVYFFRYGYAPLK